MGHFLWITLYLVEFLNVAIEEKKQKHELNMQYFCHKYVDQVGGEFLVQIINYYAKTIITILMKFEPVPPNQSATSNVIKLIKSPWNGQIYCCQRCIQNFKSHAPFGVMMGLRCSTLGKNRTVEPVICDHLLVSVIVVVNDRRS